MRISDWSSDVCSSDLQVVLADLDSDMGRRTPQGELEVELDVRVLLGQFDDHDAVRRQQLGLPGQIGLDRGGVVLGARSEEHTSELQSLMRISYAVFCLKKKKQKTEQHYDI